MRTLILAILMVTAFAANALAQGTTRVELRSGVRAERGASITLSQVARLEGPLADTLGRLVVLGEVVGASDANVIEPDDILDTIAAAHPRARHAVLVTGLPCRVLVPGAARRASAERGAPREETRPVDQSTPLAMRIKRQIRAALGFEHLETRFTFRGRDAEFLSQEIAGTNVVMTLGGRSDTVPVHVTIYRGDTLVDYREVRVGVEVRRSVAVMLEAVRSREVLTEDVVRIEARWLPAGDRPADPARLIGQTAKSSLRAGEVVSVIDTQPPVVVERGDVVVLRSISGGAMVGVRARAMRDARAGDVITFKRETTGTLVQARVSRAGQAVMAAPPSTSAVPANDPAASPKPTKHDTGTEPTLPANAEMNGLRRYRR